MKALDFRVIIHDIQACPKIGWENIIVGNPILWGFKALRFSEYCRNYFRKSTVK